MIDFTKNGRLISMSKSLYRNSYPHNIIVFNANICTESKGKIWHGDLDVTLDESELKRLACEIGEKVYILREMDGRFKAAANPKLEAYVAIFEPNGNVILK